MSNSNAKFNCRIQRSNSNVDCQPPIARAQKQFFGPARLPVPNGAGPKNVFWARANASPQCRGPKKKCLGPRDCQPEAFGSARACPQLMSFINVSHSCQISMSNINCQMKMSNSFNLWGSLAASN